MAVLLDVFETFILPSCDYIRIWIYKFVFQVFLGMKMCQFAGKNKVLSHNFLINLKHFNTSNSTFYVEK